jgi:hypothetical protein
MKRRRFIVNAGGALAAAGRLRTEFRDKVEVLSLPAPVPREFRKLTAKVLKEQSAKSLGAEGACVLHAFIGARPPVGPHPEGAYPQLVAG